MENIPSIIVFFFFLFPIRTSPGLCNTIRFYCNEGALALCHLCPIKWVSQCRQTGSKMSQCPLVRKRLRLCKGASVCFCALISRCAHLELERHLKWSSEEWMFFLQFSDLIWNLRNFGEEKVLLHKKKKKKKYQSFHTVRAIKLAALGINERPLTGPVCTILVQNLVTCVRVNCYGSWRSPVISGYNSTPDIEM